MVSFVIAGEWQTLIFISSCPFEGSVFLFPTFKKATPCITSYITLALWQSRKQSRYLSRKCDLAIKVCPIYLEPGFNERVKQFWPDNHRFSDPNQTFFLYFKKKGNVKYLQQAISWFSIWVYHLGTWSWEKSPRARSKLVPPLCEEGCGLFMRALEAQYPGSTLKYAFIAHLFYWHCLDRGQHSNCSLLSCSITRLKNHRSQATPLFLDNYWELKRQMFNPVPVSSALAKWLSFCGSRWRMRVRGGRK